MCRKDPAGDSVFTKDSKEVKGTELQTDDPAGGMLGHGVFCLELLYVLPMEPSISVVGEQRVGSRGDGVRVGVLWAADLPSISRQLISFDCTQAAYCGTYPSPGVCETPARCGCLPELVHPGGHQRKEVRALGPGEVPDRRAWASYLFSSCGCCIHHGGRSRKTECLTSESACGGPFSGKGGSGWCSGSGRLDVGNSLSSNT